jgi:hypothetical protein
MTAGVVNLATGEALPAAQTIRLGVGDGDVAANLDLGRMMADRLAIIAASGAGKSFLIRRICEQANGRVQQVIIDPDGEFNTLADCFEYVVLSSTDALAIGGEALATDLRARRYDIVIDLSDAEDEERMAFLADLCAGLMDVDRSLWLPLLVVVDEVQKLVPKGDDGLVDKEVRNRAIKKLADLMGRGRKRGLTAIIASGRISETATPVVSKTVNCLIGRTVFDRDVERAAFALGKTKGKASGLRRLADGEFIGSGPAFGPRAVRFNVAPVKTRHGGKTPALEQPPLLTAEDARAGLASLVKAAPEMEVVPAYQRRVRKDRHVLTNGELETIRQAFSSGKTMRDLSHELNVSYDTVSRAARRLGLDFFSRRAWADAELAIVRDGSRAGKSTRRIRSELVAAGFDRSISAVQGRRHTMDLSTPRDETLWSEEARAVVRAGYAAKKTREAIAADVTAATGRPCTKSSVGWLAGEMGLNKAPAPWSPEEIAYLKEHYKPGGNARAIAAHLGRPIKGTFTMANTLGLQLHRPWTKEQQDLVIQMHKDGKSLIEVANAVGRKYPAVAKVAEKMGLSFRANRTAESYKPKSKRTAEVARAGVGVNR